MPRGCRRFSAAAVTILAGTDQMSATQRLNNRQPRLRLSRAVKLHGPHPQKDFDARAARRRASQVTCEATALPQQQTARGRPAPRPRGQPREETGCVSPTRPWRPGRGCSQARGSRRRRRRSRGGHPGWGRSPTAHACWRARSTWRQARRPTTRKPGQAPGTHGRRTGARPRADRGRRSSEERPRRRWRCPS